MLSLKKIKLEYWGFGILIAILLIVLYAMYGYKNHYKVVTELELEETHVTVDFTATYDDEYINMFGWGCILGETIRNVDMSLILWDSKENKGYQIPVQFQKREDVTAYFNDGFNYDNSGFICSVHKDNIELNEYEVYLRYRSNNNRVDQYIGRIILR